MGSTNVEAMNNSNNNIPPERKWTIYDIAREVGVSTNTVSKVLNRKPGVGAAMRRRIEEIIRHVGYTPHIGARGLRAKRNACIGVTVPAPFDVVPVSQSFLLWLFTLLYEVFSDKGEYICFDLNPFAAGEDVDYSRGVSERLFKACLLVGPLAPNDVRLSQIHRSGIPYLTLGRLNAMPECSSATVDYVAGAYMSARYLLERGHRRVAMLKAFQGFQPGIERRRGYERALAEFDLPVDEALIKNVTFGGRDLAHRVEDLLRDHSVTALIECSATEDGASIREGMLRAGRRPGEDIEVVSWTYQQDASVLREESTHVWLPVREAATEGIWQLADWTYGRRNGPINIVYQPELYETCGEKEIKKPKRLFEPRE